MRNFILTNCQLFLYVWNRKTMYIVLWPLGSSQANWESFRKGDVKAERSGISPHIMLIPSAAWFILLCQHLLSVSTGAWGWGLGAEQGQSAADEREAAWIPCSPWFLSLSSSPTIPNCCPWIFWPSLHYSSNKSTHCSSIYIIDERTRVF